MNKRLYRSDTDKMIGGVCSGLGEYLGIDPTIVRIFFVLLGLADGFGGLIYLVLWLVLPPAGQTETTSLEQTIRAGTDEIAERARALGGELREASGRPHPQTNLIIGGVLVLFGALFLIRNLDITWLRWLNFGMLWPALLIVAGVVLLTRHLKGE
ncbi:MAG: PspC domain-containing protein [Anaerolineae bacterium]|nr:PspC domain-containing protein [Anaerolineae bacterium]